MVFKNAAESVVLTSALANIFLKNIFRYIFSNKL